MLTYIYSSILLNIYIFNWKFTLILKLFKFNDFNQSSSHLDDFDFWLLLLFFAVDDNDGWILVWDTPSAVVLNAQIVSVHGNSEES